LIPNDDTVVEDLKIWLVQLVADAPHRKGELTKIDIDLVKRPAINEIDKSKAYAAP
jgi:hypothetical protein